MSDCCRNLPPGPKQKQPERCGSCKQPGKPVARETVEALTKPEFRDTVNGRASAFCETPTCPVVYYAADGSQVLKTQLRVRVGVKETEDPIPVCYCFHVTERMIREEIEQTGRSTASVRIRAEVKVGNCRCEVENPSGKCCLGEVIQAEKVAARSRGTRGPTDAPAEPHVLSTDRRPARSESDCPAMAQTQAGECAGGAGETIHSSLISRRPE